MRFSLYLLAFLSCLSLLTAGGINAKNLPAEVDIFTGRDLSGWVGMGGEATNWAAKKGELHALGGTDGVRLLMTDRDYADFDFSLQFNAPAGVNTGVFFRLPAEGGGRPAFAGNEIQIVDEKADRYAEKMTDDRRMGAHYSVAPPRTKPPALRAGEWQTFRIRCVGSLLKVWIDGVLVQDTDMLSYPTKVKKEHTGLTQTKGRIGLQSKDVPVRFRDIRITEIDES